MPIPNAFYYYPTHASIAYSDTPTGNDAIGILDLNALRKLVDNEDNAERCLYLSDASHILWQTI